MAITLTTSAADRVRGRLASRGRGEGLRLTVKTSGCSGLSYVVNFADEVADDDRVYTSHGVKVVVDAESLPFLDGTEIDFAADGLAAAFKFNNPNVIDECGCGESFTVNET
ncbi:MAG: iron-sulfur cluster assembly accessory protein [Arenicellales bacterium]|jgi:iron-sulfur cluster assembly protein|nr:iron-sulfur cluster assembly accessory protein [Arenicellales bacterium]